MRSILVVIAMTTAATAVAQDDDAARARALFDEGFAAGEAGNWEEAARLFRESRAILDRASTVFNLAVALEHLDRDDEARAALDDYFAIAPPEDSRRAQARALRDRLAGATTPPPIDPRPDPPIDPPRDPVPAATAQNDPGGWILFGAGAAVLIAGIALAIVGQLDFNAISSLEGPAQWTEHEDDWDRAHVLVGVGWAAIGVGAITGSIGVALAITASGSEHSSAELRLTPHRIALRGTF